MKNVAFISWFDGTWQRKLAIKDLKVLNQFQKQSTILEKMFCILQQFQKFSMHYIKNLVYHLPYELSNNLKLRMLGN